VNLGNLEGKVALVTGGSRGIGRSICLSLCKAGAYVFINYSSSPAAAQETADLCAQASGRSDCCELLQFNVSDKVQVEAGISVIKEKKAKLDILVNNAGLSRDGLALRFKDEDWDLTLDTNLKGAFFVIRAALKMIMKSSAGRIINISSVVADMGNAGQIAYVASKAGLNGMTRSLALEVASRAVTVNAVAPGFIVSDMTAALNEQTIEHYKQEIPLGRFGDPEEVANLVTFLASESSSYITGQVIGINGGMRL
jgi:3-oxoacyl-[acyl-carrier protein] reductase